MSNMVDAEPAKRISEEILHRGGPSIIAQLVAGNIAQRTELHAEYDAVAVPARKRLADQHFVMAHAVEIAGVEQGDAGLERRMNGRDAFVAICRTIEIGHAHAAE